MFCSLRYYRTKGFARFRCGRCNRSWNSAHAWCIVDLRKQCVSRLYGQVCNKCECNATPIFDRDVMRRMAEYAVNRYLERVGRRQRPHMEINSSVEVRDDRGPHEEDKCEMCKELGRSCWKSKTSNHDVHDDDGEQDDDGRDDDDERDYSPEDDGRDDEDERDYYPEDDDDERDYYPEDDGRDDDYEH